MKGGGNLISTWLIFILDIKIFFALSCSMSLIAKYATFLMVIYFKIPACPSPLPTTFVWNNSFIIVVTITLSILQGNKTSVPYLDKAVHAYI